MVRLPNTDSKLTVNSGLIAHQSSLALSPRCEWSITTSSCCMAHAWLGKVLLPLQNRGEMAVLYAFPVLFLAVAGTGTWGVDGQRAASLGEVSRISEYPS